MPLVRPGASCLLLRDHVSIPLIHETHALIHGADVSASLSDLLLISGTDATVPCCLCQGFMKLTSIVMLIPTVCSMRLIPIFHEAGTGSCVPVKPIVP
jgi:hypothetical protein